MLRNNSININDGFEVNDFIMENIAVLLAVYNGRPWVDEQLQSILNQTDVNVDIYISVDLSDDNSYEYLIEKYSSYENIYILQYGKRYGSAGKNFFRLIKEVNLEKYNYTAFSDQDDIWDNAKLKQAISAINKKNVDAYSGNVTAFWENGSKAVIDKAQRQVQYDYFFEAAGPGCTYVFTRKLAIDFQKLLNSSKEANDIALHDWLLYAFARSNDFKWYIDKNSYMLYRQHSSNEVGANSSIKAWKKRIILVNKGWYKKEVCKLINLFNKNNAGLLIWLYSDSYAKKILLAFKTYKLRRRLRDRITLSLFFIMNIF